VNCEHVRLLIGADPTGNAATVQEHLPGCPACAAFLAEMQGLDGRIRLAMQQPPDLPQARIAPRAPRPRAAPAWRRYALAASVLLATALVLGTWVLRPSDSLARDVVTHVQGEPDSWLSERQVDAAGLAQALAGAGVALNLTSDKIVYAQSCFFHGHYVPHMVLETDQGPTTVLLLRHEHVTARQVFHEAGMSGVIVPAAGGGGIAVLARGNGNLDGVAAQMQADVRWLPQPH
jgi:hypothetical protein